MSRTQGREDLVRREHDKHRANAADCDEEGDARRDAGIDSGRNARLDSRENDNRNTDRDAGEPLDDSGFDFTRCGRWRRQGLGQFKLEGLPLPRRSVLRHDEGRRIHVRSRCDCQREPRRAWEGLLILSSKRCASRRSQPSKTHPLFP